MNITKESRNLTTRERYNLTMSPAIKKMRDVVGLVLNVSAYVVYEDEDKDGKTQTLLSIMADDGVVYATNSPTFQRDFLNMAKIFEDAGEEIGEIEIMSGNAKSGREFVTCKLA